MGVSEIGYGENEKGRLAARQWAARRRRSDGPLDTAEIAWCRSNGVELAFDPVQQGVVPLDGVDDIVGTDATLPGSLHHDLRPPGEVTFRRWRSSDADTFASLLGNERLWRHLPDPFPGKIDRAAALDLISLSNNAEHHDVYAVEHRGVVMGQARLLFDVSATKRDRAEISYWLGEPFWGRKFGSALVAAFTGDCFARFPSLKAIVARVHKENVASARALTKARYRAEPNALPEPWQLFIAVREAKAPLPPNAQEAPRTEEVAVGRD